MQLVVRRLATAGATAAAAIAARKAVEVGWHMVRGEDPPTSGIPQDDTELRDLLIWTAVLSAAVVIARKVATSATDSIFGDDEA
jgi:hypothetical protein